MNERTAESIFAKNTKKTETLQNGLKYIVLLRNPELVLYRYSENEYAVTFNGKQHFKNNISAFDFIEKSIQSVIKKCNKALKGI